MKKLGRGGACPHGNLCDLDSPAKQSRRGSQLLSEAEPGKSYSVRSVYERDPSWANCWTSAGIRPGSEFHLRERNYDQTLSLDTDRGRHRAGQPGGRERSGCAAGSAGKR